MAAHHPVQHRDVMVATLGSGSRGNCTFIGTQERGVLVDCGLSTKQTLKRMAEIGLEDTRIMGVFLTHEHADHVGAARILCERLHRRQERWVPFYMTGGTASGLNPKCMPRTARVIQSGRPIQLEDWVVEPWTVPHDTIDPVAYAVQIEGTRAGVITDLGRSTRLVERQLGSLDIAVLEFNHDLEMLVYGDYPWRLKQRVKGAHGHLSNRQAADVVRRGATPRLKHLVLAHLSEDNNDPDIALRAAQEGLHASSARGVTVHVASQQIPLGPLKVRTPRSLRAPSPRSRPRTRRAAPPPIPENQLSLFG